MDMMMLTPWSNQCQEVTNGRSLSHDQWSWEVPQIISKSFCPETQMSVLEKCWTGSHGFSDLSHGDVWKSISAFCLHLFSCLPFAPLPDRSPSSFESLLLFPVSHAWSVKNPSLVGCFFHELVLYRVLHVAMFSYPSKTTDYRMQIQRFFLTFVLYSFGFCLFGPQIQRAEPCGYGARL